MPLSAPLCWLSGQNLRKKCAAMHSSRSGYGCGAKYVRGTVQDLRGTCPAEEELKKNQYFQCVIRILLPAAKLVSKFVRQC